MACRIHYKYRLADSQGTTGYAACEPDPKPEFDQAIALLETRPLDTFLHMHLLTQIRDLAREEWLALAGGCRSRAMAGLLAETALLAPNRAEPEAAQFLRQLAGPWHDATPLALLAQEMAKRDRPTQKALWRNIHEHELIEPEILAALPKAREITAKTRLQPGGRASALAKPAQPPDGRKTASAASVALAEQHIAEGGEMRHEATLCPIALLRPWRLRAGVGNGRNEHVLDGGATAYGRGLTLVQARVSCLMEIVERASAHTFALEEEIGGRRLIRASWQELARDGIAAVAPSSLQAIAGADAMPLFWLEGEGLNGPVLVPAQAVYLFCNLDEVSVCGHIGSTGLASGASAEMAKLAALTEILERDAHATAPFLQQACFELRSRDPIIQGLLADYRWRGIEVQFQDISNEFGFPVYRAFVRRQDGSLAQATGAGMRGAKAALAALTETPFPYSWATPARTPSGPGLRNLPVRILEDLPDYSLPDMGATLAKLERTLAANGHAPVYVDISRKELGFPVYRAFIPGMAIDTELETEIHPRLAARFHTAFDNRS